MQDASSLPAHTHNIGGISELMRNFAKDSVYLKLTMGIIKMPVYIWTAQRCRNFIKSQAAVQLGTSASEGRSGVGFPVVHNNIPLSVCDVRLFASLLFSKKASKAR